MVVDVHCHIGLSARRASPALKRFSFEPRGSRGQAGFDSYFSPRVLRKWGAAFQFSIVREATGLDLLQPPGDALDAQIEQFNDRHFSGAFAAGVDRLVLLAFDEYHYGHGLPAGPPRAPSPMAMWISQRRSKNPRPSSPDPSADAPQFVQNGRSRWHKAHSGLGSDLYVSNTCVRSLCDAQPDRFWFGASLHPYRTHDGRPAWELLDELKTAGARLIKWLPIHQNIRAGDPRTVAFLRRAAEVNMALLIHYGGEMTLARQHMEFESPAEMLDVLRDLRRDGQMPTTIIAHAATPSLRFQSAAGHRLLMDALMYEFRDAPLYADISALAALGRAPWLPRLAKRRELHDKLVWGTDFPVPLFPLVYWPRLGRRVFDIGRIDSWIARDLALKREMGFDEGVFHRAGELLL